MRTLIIGGTGIIGSSIAKTAIQNGDAVVSISRAGKEKRKRNDIPQLNSVQFNWYDEKEAEQFLAGKMFDVIVDCVVFNVNQLEYSLQRVKSHCKQYVFVSSCSVNDHKLGSSETEIDGQTQWEYAINKLKCEEWLLTHEMSFQWTIIRPGVIYNETRIPYAVVGRANHWTIVERILKDKPILGCQDNDSLHPVMHEDDFGRMAYIILGNELANKEIFNVGSENGVTWDSVIGAIEKTINKKAQVVHIPIESYREYYNQLYQEVAYDKIKQLTLNCSKIKAISKEDLIEKVTLDAGIKNTVDFLRKNYSTKRLDENYDYYSDFILDKCFTKHLILPDEKEIVAGYIGKIGIIERMRARTYILLRSIKKMFS